LGHKEKEGTVKEGTVKEDTVKEDTVKEDTVLSEREESHENVHIFNPMYCSSRRL
jgi:hypothetical protein